MAPIKTNIGTADVEIGTSRDWTKFTLVEVIGTITGGDGSKIELLRDVGGVGFELRCDGDLSMRINLKSLLMECAAELVAEQQRRATTAA